MFGIFKKKKKFKFYHTEYNVYLILNKSTELKIHDWEQWKKCFEELNGVIGNHSEKMNIRTCQSFLGSSKWLSFGRMVWSEKNNIKWTSKYKSGENKIENLEFSDTEFWAPSWTICDKENISPSIFIKVDTSENGLLKEYFDETILIAVKKDNPIIEIDLIKRIFEKLDGNYLIKGVRQWGKEASENSWTDSLMDFSPYDLLNKEELSKLEINNNTEVFGEWKMNKNVW